MTEQDWIELGRRAVACRGWRWMPGMLVRYTADAWCRVTEANSYGWPPTVIPPNSRNAWPDFRDPATLGCLLALVREAWGSQDVGVILYDGRAHVHDGHCDDGLWIAGDDTEAAALVAALESAP